MNIIKNIGKKIIEGGIEGLKEEAKKTSETVTSQVTGGEKKNEFVDYLKKLDPSLTPEKIASMTQEDIDKLAETRKTLQNAVPQHLIPRPAPSEPRPYEVAVREEEEKKKAQAAEAQRRSQSELPIMSQKQARGMLGAKQRHKPTGFETGKNIKVG